MSQLLLSVPTALVSSIRKTASPIFPSFALAWRINQEEWMKEFDKVSNLKLRLGWGQVGNQAISPYQTLASYNSNSSAKPDGSLEPGIVPSRIPNADLKWETSEQYNIGVDLGLFNQRLTFTADAYIKKTKDLLQQIALPLCQWLQLYVGQQWKDRKQGT